jgi:hypothetical protein
MHQPKNASMVQETMTDLEFNHLLLGELKKTAARMNTPSKRQELENQIQREKKVEMHSTRCRNFSTSQKTRAP